MKANTNARAHACNSSYNVRDLREHINTRSCHYLINAAYTLIFNLHSELVYRLAIDSRHMFQAIACIVQFYQYILDFVIYS